MKIRAKIQIPEVEPGTAAVLARPNGTSTDAQPSFGDPAAKRAIDGPVSGIRDTRSATADAKPAQLRLRSATKPRAFAPPTADAPGFWAAVAQYKDVDSLAAALIALNKRDPAEVTLIEHLLAPVLHELGGLNQENSGKFMILAPLNIAGYVEIRGSEPKKMPYTEALRKVRDAHDDPRVQAQHARYEELRDRGDPAANEAWNDRLQALERVRRETMGPFLDAYREAGAQSLPSGHDKQLVVYGPGAIDDRLIQPDYVPYDYNTLAGLKDKEPEALMEIVRSPRLLAGRLFSALYLRMNRASDPDSGWISKVPEASAQEPRTIDAVVQAFRHMIDGLYRDQYLDLFPHRSPRYPVEEAVLSLLRQEYAPQSPRA